MPLNFYGLYVPTECSSNNIEMAEDDHVPDNTERMDLAEDIEAAQCVIIANVVISSEAGPDLRPFLKYKSYNSSHCKNCKYLLLLFKPGKAKSCPSFPCSACLVSFLW